MNISGPAAVAKPEMLFYAPGDLTVTFKHGTEVYMSRYEYGVLSLMAQHPGKLFTKEQIFEAVWHKDSESYLRAVTSTIGRIRQKIEDDKDHPRYIKTVSNIGYQFVPSSESVRLNRNL